MVFPVNNIKLKIGTAGRGSTEAQMAVVRDMEHFSIGFDNEVAQWSPIDQEGWARRLLTGKSLTVSLSGKRNYGDLGNDYVAGCAYANGNDAATVLEVRFPNGDTLRLNCVVSVTSSDGGGAGDVAALEFECFSDGQPVYTRIEN